MSVLPLHVDGADLKTSDGKVFKAVGCSEFAQFKRWLQPNGQAALVEPIITERTQLARDAGYDGPLVARVFRCAAGANPFALDPWSYPMHAVTEFTQCYNDHGWYVDWTGGDFHLCFPNPDPHNAGMGQVDGAKGINQHNNLFCAALMGTQAIWNTCNEPFKNGVDVTQVVPPPWAPAVQYSGQYDPYTGSLSCINLHTDRGEEAGAHKWVGKAHESAPYVWRYGKPIFYDEPMGADENDIPNRRSNVPQYFGILGTVIAMVNGVYFHSTPGLSSDGFGPVVKNCWIEFCRGIVGGLKV